MLSCCLLMHVSCRFAQKESQFAFNSGLFYVVPNLRTIELMERLETRLSRQKYWDQTAYNEEIFFLSHGHYKSPKVGLPRVCGVGMHTWAAHRPSSLFVQGKMCGAWEGVCDVCAQRPLVLLAGHDRSCHAGSLASAAYCTKHLQDGCCHLIESRQRGLCCLVPTNIMSCINSIDKGCLVAACDCRSLCVQWTTTSS